MELFSYKLNGETIIITKKQIYLCGGYSSIRLCNTPLFVCIYVNGEYIGLAKRDLFRLYINHVVEVSFYKDDVVRIFCKTKGV